MLFYKRICHGLAIASLCLPLFSFAATPIKSIVIFGDSLSDNGNTTHLLKSLRKDENPAYLVKPLKVFVIHKMEDFAEEYYVPQIILDAGIFTVNEFFDYKLAPMLADLVSNIKKVPILPAEPYWQSRFSNGRVWIEYLAPMLGVDREDNLHYSNQAFSGSWAATYDYQLTITNLIKHPLTSLKNLIIGKLIPPSLGLSVQAYLLMHPKLDKDTAYFVFAGGNDYLNMLQFDTRPDDEKINSYIDNVLDNIAYSVKKLADAGAKHIIVMGLPHIGDSPKFVHSNERNLLNISTDMHNIRLKDRLAEWQEDAPEIEFVFLDVDQFLAKAQIDPAAYGFTNIEDPCIDVKLPSIRAYANSPFAHNYVLHYAHVLQYREQGAAQDAKNWEMCENPNAWLFWDEVHPTTRAHHYMAAEACENLKALGYQAQCTQPELF